MPVPGLIETIVVLLALVLKLALPLAAVVVIVLLFLRVRALETRLHTLEEKMGDKRGQPPVES